MCGYIRRVTDSPAIRELMDRIGLGDLAVPLVEGATSPLEHFYPAFGGNAGRKIRGMIIQNQNDRRLVDPTWWFDCREEGPDLVVGDRTTFNARNLNSTYWKGALRHHRGVVVATGLGESKWVGKTKHQYLMEGDTAFLLGTLYRPFTNGQFSCAVITRDSHPKMEPYHDKAFPLFLPPDPDFLATWLDPLVTEAPEIEDLLAHPVLYPSLTVTPVKSYKGAQAVGESIQLSSDLA